MYLELLEFWVENHLTYQLGNPISFVNFEFNITVIKHDNTQISTVVLIHHSSCYTTQIQEKNVLPSHISLKNRYPF